MRNFTNTRNSSSRNTYKDFGSPVSGMKHPMLNERKTSSSRRKSYAPNRFSQKRTYPKEGNVGLRNSKFMSYLSKSDIENNPSYREYFINPRQKENNKKKESLTSRISPVIVEQIPNIIKVLIVMAVIAIIFIVYTFVFDKKIFNNLITFGNGSSDVLTQSQFQPLPSYEEKINDNYEKVVPIQENDTSEVTIQEELPSEIEEISKPKTFNPLTNKDINTVQEILKQINYEKDSRDNILEDFKNKIEELENQNNKLITQNNELQKNNNELIEEVESMKAIVANIDQGKVLKPKKIILPVDKQGTKE